MITLFCWIVNRFLNDNDWEVNYWLLATAFIDGIIAWALICDCLSAYLNHT